jgi:hypothetical protein
LGVDPLVRDLIPLLVRFSRGRRSARQPRTENRLCVSRPQLGLLALTNCQPVPASTSLLPACHRPTLKPRILLSARAVQPLFRCINRDRRRQSLLPILKVRLAFRSTHPNRSKGSLSISRFPYPSVLLVMRTAPILIHGTRPIPAKHRGPLYLTFQSERSMRRPSILIAIPLLLATIRPPTLQYCTRPLVQNIRRMGHQLVPGLRVRRL